MIHVIRRIERRLGHAPGKVREPVRIAWLAALSGLIALGALTAIPARAQETQETQETAEPAANGTAADFDPVQAATAVLDAMDAGDFAAVRARFDEAMTAAVSEAQLGAIWTALPTQVGAARGRGEAQTKTRDGTRLVRIPLRYENATIDALFAFESDGKLSGFRLAPAAADTAKTSPPVPADANYAERDLQIGDAEAPLPATLALPKGKGPFPAVVLVHGSGPHDRDETIGPNKPFLDLARGLAERGIAVLRYEKRTRAHPSQFADGGDIDRETTDDAVKATALLRTLPGIDPKRVYVFGHSQGGMMAPRIGSRDPAIAGLILLAAPSRPLLDILIEQNRRMAVLNDGRTDDSENAELAKLVARVAAIRRGEQVSGADAPLGMPTAYWKSIEAVDPVAEALTTQQPLLFLQGARDLQVVDADWQRWKDAFHNDPRATFKLYETLNHLGIPGEGTLQDYGTAGQVAPELIADVAAWIRAQGRKEK